MKVFQIRASGQAKHSMCPSSTNAACSHGPRDLASPSQGAWICLVGPIPPTTQNTCGTVQGGGSLSHLLAPLQAGRCEVGAVPTYVLPQVVGGWGKGLSEMAASPPHFQGPSERVSCTLIAQGFLLALAHPALSGRLHDSPVCLSPEISLDVDADRDGVVEKNSPRKVPSYQGTRPWTGGHGAPGGAEPQMDAAVSRGPPREHGQIRTLRPSAGSHTACPWQSPQRSQSTFLSRFPIPQDGTPGS